jgi:hypothetical protein
MVRRFLLGVAITAAALLSQGCLGSPAPGEPNPVAPPAPEASQAAGGATSPRAVSGPAPAQGQPPASSKPGSTQPRAPGSALRVRPNVERDQAGTALIGAARGGRVEVESAGVTYRLEIPPDALLGDEVITLSPISHIDELPLSGGLLGAVELQPHGLRLVRPATLTIQMPGNFKAADLMGFAYQGDGEEFHLYPVSAEGTTITASLMHFSGYGAGQGTEADSKAQQDRQPTAAEARFEQEMAAAFEKARRAGGDVSHSNDDFERALLRFFNYQVMPGLKAAESNDQVCFSAISEYLSWLRSVELLGLRERFESQISQADASAKKALRNAFDRAAERCARELDWKQGMEMLRYARWNNTLYGGEAEWGDLWSKLEECWRFRLDYESIVEWDLGSSDIRVTAHVKSQVPLKMRDDLTAFDGRAPLEYVEYSISSALDSFCEVQTETTNTYLSVSPFVFSVNLAATSPSTVRALLDPGAMTETWSMVCGWGAGNVWTEMPFPAVGWSAGFHTINKKRELHESVINGVPEGKPKYLFTDFQEVGKTVALRESGFQEATVDGATVTEAYTIDVIHTPKGGATESTKEPEKPKVTPTPRTPVGPKTTDASALPAELKQVPMPPQFGVVEGSTTRTAPEGSFQMAQASLWGPGSIQGTVDFYNRALLADWNPGDESVGQSSFSMSFTSKGDSRRTLSLDGKTDGDGVRVLETVQQK